MFYASLRDMVLYLYKDEQGLRQQTQFLNMNNAVRLHHSLATLADDYKKKHHVFRLQTSDGAEFLFQAGWVGWKLYDAAGGGDGNDGGGPW